MKKIDRPAFLWAKPAPTNPLLHRALLVTESNVPPIKEFVIFDEIFPAKKNPDDAEDGTTWMTENTFHRAIGPLLAVGQCFGVLPVTGLLAPDASHLKFSWTNWRVAYTLLITALTAGMVLMSCARIVATGIDIYKTISLMFFASSMTSLILFLRLAPRWPAIGVAMSQGELNHSPFFLQGHRRKKYSLRVRFNICLFGVMFFALVEHLLSIIAGVVLVRDCPTNDTALASYFLNSYPQVFYFTSYSDFKGFFLQSVNFSVTFNWNFIDLFILVLSIALTDRFELLGDRLDLLTGKHLSEQLWKAARTEFANLAQLVRRIDMYINEIVLLSFTNNLYFICLQLFNTLNADSLDSGSTNPRFQNRSGCVCRPARRITHFVYFVFSFGFLLTRSVVVSLGAARIHSAAQRPAPVLYAVPSESYCQEVRRFLEQVTTDVIALTGLNFFYVTRGLILSIAGTIVTYELVLVQFNGSTPPLTTNITITDSCGNKT